MQEEGKNVQNIWKVNNYIIFLNLVLEISVTPLCFKTWTCCA